MGTPETEYSTEWIKIPITAPLVFVGREAVCIGAGCYLLFYSLANGQQQIYTATDKVAGEGIHCYAGHRQQAIVAFAEKCLDPKIIFLTYPAFQKLKPIEKGAAEGYLAITFSDHEYLITLSDLPRFEITIWNWRLQQKLCAQLTKMRHPEQILNCSYHSPDVVVQYYKNASKFILWDIYNSYKSSILLKHNIEMPNNDTIVCCTWNTESGLFVLNEYGCIYMLNSEQHVLELIIHGPNIGNEMPCFVWYKCGILIVEPNLDIKHFKRSGKWFEDWSVAPIKILQLIASSGKDYLIGWSTNGEILELDMSKFSFTVRKQFVNNFKDICQINPNYNVFVTYSTTNDVQIWNVTNGMQVGCYHAEDDINSLASNPRYPYVGVGLATGVLLLISAYTTTEPAILATFILFKKEINKIIFNEEGNIIVAANLNHGQFFIIKGLPGETMQVIIYINYLRETVDICVTEDEKNYRLYILVQNEKSKPIGDRVILKTVTKTNLKVRKKKFIATHNAMYSKLVISGGQFYAQPYNSKKFYLVELKKKKISIANSYLSGHLLKYINFGIDKFHLYTYGLDGLVIVRALDLEEVLAVVLPHSPMDTGIQTVLVDPYLRYVVSLGNDGVLVCTKLVNVKVKPAVIKEDAKKLFELGFLFKNPTIGYVPTGEDVGKVYLEMKYKEKLNEDHLQCAKERKAIMDEFLILKREVIHLLNANLSGPNLEKIDISEFYLHSRLKDYKEKLNEKECEWTVTYSHELIKQQDDLWHKMKTSYWDTMIIQRCVIKSLFSNFGVENYIGLPPYVSAEHRFTFANMSREFEKILVFDNLFKPWTPMSDEMIEDMLTKELEITYKDENARIMAALQVDEDDEEEIEKIDESVDYEDYPSTVVPKYIEWNKNMYPQEQIFTYMQMFTQKLFISHDTVLLRDYFNVHFNNIMEIKVREVKTIIDKNNRLRYILSELKNTDITIGDPVWQSSEDPYSVIVVKDSEVGITPYISPSEQAHLDWLAEEEERIRLLMLSDNFREKALMQMMDGVLEIRWEDTLKRDIPKPKCMLEKKPETFNEEDIRAARDYEEKVAFLNSERQRYKNMLEQEYGKVAESIREGVRKFNIKLRELLLLKIKIETGRSQQTLMREQMQNRCKTNIITLEKEKQIIDAIKNNDLRVIWVQQKLQDLTIAALECRGANEYLFVKDKQLDKNFKKDLQDVSALVQEQAHKLYKKNPKVQVRGINNVSVLTELGSCCVSHERTLILTNECWDYLKSVDSLDQYVGVPNTIDEILYKIICRHRRLRLENDILIKGNVIDQTEIECANQVFQKELARLKEIGNKLTYSLDALREEDLTRMHNKKLQIVIAQGLVEVPMKGLISDFDKAIMVNRSAVENINTIIRKVGQMKIKVMNDKMLHRRIILMKEWEHKTMKMKIEDLNQFLDDLKRVKVTKEILLYLHQKGKGESLDKGSLTLDQEVEMTKKSYEKMVLEKQKAVTELETQIKDYMSSNKKLDRKIIEINIDVCEQRSHRDYDFEKKEKLIAKKRMVAFVKRSKLVQQIQAQYNEILVLQSELELLRLKTYPTLKFKTL